MCFIGNSVKEVVTILSLTDLSRFKREEAKIQAWENHEKAKAEAEMRRVEVRGSHLDNLASLTNNVVIAVLLKSSRLPGWHILFCNEISSCAFKQKRKKKKKKKTKQNSSYK